MDTEQKLSQFEARVRQAVAVIFPQAPLSVIERRRHLLKIRIELGEKTFIDIFYNSKNDRTDFALIHGAQRTFGYDNLGGWHRHPAEDPTSHIPCDEPSVDQVLQEMKNLPLTAHGSPDGHP